MPEPKILMNPGPRLEEIFALYLHQEITGQAGEIIFRDTHGDPGSSVLDIDVREPYPRGSSAFEQMAQRLGCAAEFAELCEAFNLDNRSGCLNRDPYRDSFVWLIPRLFDLAPQEPAERDQYRRYIITEVQELADVAFWAFTNPDLRHELHSLHNGQRYQFRHWPQRQNFVKNWPEMAQAYPSPLCLAGYIYLRFLREEKVELINLSRSKWQDMFTGVAQEFGQVVERLRVRRPQVFQLRNLWAGYLEVEHNFDSRAFFSIYKNFQLLVAYDRRGPVPQATILVRHGADLQAMMNRLHQALNEREPDCWHYDQRAVPGPTGSLLNGGRNRFREHSSQLAADPQTIFALINQCM